MKAVHEVEYAVPADRRPPHTAVANQTTSLLFEDATVSEAVPLPMFQPLPHQSLDVLELGHQIRRVVLDDQGIRQDPEDRYGVSLRRLPERQPCGHQGNGLPRHLDNVPTAGPR